MRKQRAIATIQVSLVEDQTQTRQGLTALIDGTPGYRCMGAWRTCEEMLGRLPAARPDVLLLDIGLPGMSGIDGARRAREILSTLPILMLTVHEDNDFVLEALCAGACGYLVKKTLPARLLEAIREAHEGGSPMSSHIPRARLTGLHVRHPASKEGKKPFHKDCKDLTFSFAGIDQRIDQKTRSMKFRYKLVGLN